MTKNLEKGRKTMINRCIICNQLLDPPYVVEGIDQYLGGMCGECKEDERDVNCDKGYKGECCCRCEYQLKIDVCSCPVCPKIEGYICLAFHIIDHSYLCVYKTSEHGCCEMFSPKRKTGRSGDMWNDNSGEQESKINT